MTLRGKIVGARWGVWAAAVAATLAFARAAGLTPYYFFPIVILVGVYAPRRISLWVVRRAYREVDRRIEREDFGGSRELIRELRGLYIGSRAATEGLRLVDAGVMSRQGRHAEAAALLSSIDAAQLSPGHRPLLLNNLAWSLALSGNPSAAVLRARESLAASDVAGDRAVTAHDLRAFQLGTLGTALVLNGDPEEGVSLLAQALARGGKPREQAWRAFYLGEGLRAMGKHEQASEAYERATKEAPSSDPAKRAAASLAGMRAYRS